MAISNAGTLLNQEKPEKSSAITRLCRVGVYIGVFVGLIASYVILLTVALSIPQRFIERHRLGSIAYLKPQGDRYPLISQWAPLDGFNDRSVMLEGGLAPFKESSMARVFSFYPRYWHGWIVFERPLLVFAGIRYLRMLSLLVLVILLCIAVYAVYKKIGVMPAVILLVSLLPARIIVVGACIYFAGIYDLLLLMIIFLCAKERKVQTVSMAFFVLGSATNFFDILSTPLLTLVFPLVVWILVREKMSISRSIRVTMGTIVAWCAGFLATWASKWILSTIVTHRNVVKDAAQQARFRTGGDLDRQPNAKSTVVGAFADSCRQFLRQGWPVVILVLIACCIMALLFHYSASVRAPLYPTLELASDARSRIYSLLIVSVLTPGWILVLHQHTQVHVFMTYRLYTGFVYVVLAILLMYLPRSIWRHPLDTRDQEANK